VDIKIPSGRRVSNLIKVFDKQSTIYPPGSDIMSNLAHSRALIGGGGDYEGTVEDPAHPKPSAGVQIVPARTESRLEIMEAMDDLGSN
jgi:hypothetical protein